jgi:O-antigen/teichoic acid export membrane protein
LSFVEPPAPPTRPAPETDPRRAALAREDYANLGVKTARGGTVMLLSQGCRFVLLLGVQIVLARLLMPEDFGLFAVVTSIITFFSLFNDLGLPTATVQRREITHEQVSLLFWLNTAWGAALALLTAAGAGLFARLYGEPRLAPVIVALSAGFVFVGLGSQHRALLRRQMRFTALALVDLLSLLAGAAAAVALAWLGYRHWALVHMRLATTASATLGLLLACGWRPGRPRRGTQVRQLLAFGTHITGFDVMAYVTRHADNLLIGLYSGPRALGFYYKAYQMLLLPAQQFSAPLGGVVIPALSRVQAEPRRFAAYYHSGILLSAAVGMPLVTFLFVGAGRVVPLLLGEQWAESVTLFRALALAAFVGTVEVGSGWLIVSLGRAGRQFKLNLLSTLATLVGFFVGVRWGAVGVALSFSLCRAAFLVPKLVNASEGSPVRWVDVFRTVSRPAAASLAAAAGLVVLNRQPPFNAHGLAGLTAGGFCFGLMYIGVWSALPGGRRTLKELVGLVRYLRRQRVS